MECFSEEANLRRRRQRARVKGALQLLINRNGEIRFAQVPDGVSTKSFVGLMIETRSRIT